MTSNLTCVNGEHRPKKRELQPIQCATASRASFAARAPVTVTVDAPFTVTVVEDVALAD